MHGFGKQGMAEALGDSEDAASDDGHTAIEEQTITTACKDACQALRQDKLGLGLGLGPIPSRVRLRVMRPMPSGHPEGHAF